MTSGNVENLTAHGDLCGREWDGDPSTRKVTAEQREVDLVKRIYI
ncbi:hypothetical protein [Catellatospora tritici]|nr:hypothetical protein [Catellatospora tritici]